MFILCVLIIETWLYTVAKYQFNAIYFTCFIVVNRVSVSCNITYNDLSDDFIKQCMVYRQLKFNVCVRCDMTFIVHRNTPNIIDLLDWFLVIHNFQVSRFWSLIHSTVPMLLWMALQIISYRLCDRLKNHTLFIEIISIWNNHLTLNYSPSMSNDPRRGLYTC